MDLTAAKVSTSALTANKLKYLLISYLKNHIKLPVLLFIFKDSFKVKTLLLNKLVLNKKLFFIRFF